MGNFLAKNGCQCHFTANVPGIHEVNQHLNLAVVPYCNVAVVAPSVGKVSKPSQCIDPVEVRFNQKASKSSLRLALRGLPDCLACLVLRLDLLGL